MALPVEMGQYTENCIYAQDIFQIQASDTLHKCIS